MDDVGPALYRMKAYAGLLLDSTTHAEKDIGQDLRVLVEWIEYAKPLLGAVSNHTWAAPNPFNRPYKGLQDQQQDTLKPQDPPKLQDEPSAA